MDHVIKVNQQVKGLLALLLAQASYASIIFSVADISLKASSRMLEQ